ncbi:DszB [Burkholderia multivorans]|nr:DszB [Burkholderia multivorans]
MPRRLKGAGAAAGRRSGRPPRACKADETFPAGTGARSLRRRMKRAANARGKWARTGCPPCRTTRARCTRGARRPIDVSDPQPSAQASDARRAPCRAHPCAHGRARRWPAPCSDGRAKVDDAPRVRSGSERCRAGPRRSAGMRVGRGEAAASGRHGPSSGDRRSAGIVSSRSPQQARDQNGVEK